MPIVRFICKRCGEVPLDHFHTSACGDHVHPDYVEAVLADDGKQRAGVRVTQAIGCARRVRLQAVEPYVADPLMRNSALTGTAWHRALEGQRSMQEVKVDGVFAGVQLQGTVDRVRPPVIEDWKHIQVKNLPYVKTAKPEHIVQISIYAYLWNAMWNTVAEELCVTRGRIWYHTDEPGGLYPRDCELMSYEECVAFRPHDGEYSLGEMYQQLAAAGDDWRSMPLAGRSQRFGMQSACNWCEVESICSEANGSPF